MGTLAVTAWACTEGLGTALLPTRWKQSLREAAGKDVGAGTALATRLEPELP